MKKIFCLTVIILAVLTSCSSDSNEENLKEPVLIKEIEVSINGKNLTQKFFYDENRIKTMIFPDGFQQHYTYTGDVITKIEEFDVQGNLSEIRKYTYDNGKIFSVLKIVYQSIAPYYDSLTKYVHNADGTVTYQKYKLHFITGEVLQEEGTPGKIYFKDGNIIKSDWSSDYSIVYEYDNKNNAYKNILGYNLLLDLEPTINNSTKSISTSKWGGVIQSSESINLYEYNSKGYPIKKQVSVENGKPFSILKFHYQ